jgi:hypothetical protein
MIENLVNRLEKFDEPTVLFMYGDHLPSLDLQDSDLDGINLYQTEWVMWDNFGLKNEKKNLTAYQASTYIFNRLGLKGGLMQSFHNKYMDSEDQEDYLDKLEMLEYDTLYGNNYAFDGENPFSQTKMTMGIRDIVVNNYKIQGDRVWIYGENFNEFSEVFIDGKSVDTQYMGTSGLVISLDDFQGGRELCVKQVGDDHIALSETNTVSIEEDTGNTETSETEQPS